MKQQKTFHYPEVMGNHFLYWHSINDHNNKQHSPISLEVVWATKYWPNHVLAFLLSVTKVNINLAATYFNGQQQMGQIEFWKLLAKTLIFNTHYNKEKDKMPDKKCKQWEYGHCLITLPKSKFWNMNHPSKQPISKTQMHFLHKKAMYLLPMLPRNLLVC